jgi:hypothetical protein
MRVILKRIDRTWGTRWAFYRGHKRFYFVVALGWVYIEVTRANSESAIRSNHRTIPTAR